MMFLLSPTLALITLVTVPLTLGITVLIAKRSQKLFVAQWKHTGELNGQIEETYTGHALVKVFGRQREVEERFRREERGVVLGQLRRPVHHRPDHAGNDIHREPGVCGDRRGGRPAGGFRGHAVGRCAGVHPVLAAVHAAAGPARVDGQSAAVGRGLRGTGLLAARYRGAERGSFDLLCAEVDARAAGVRECVLLLLAGQAADLGPEPGGRARADGGDRRAHRSRQDHPGEPHDAVL